MRSGPGEDGEVQTRSPAAVGSDGTWCRRPPHPRSFTPSAQRGAAEGNRGDAVQTAPRGDGAVPLSALRGGEEERSGTQRTQRCFVGAVRSDHTRVSRCRGADGSGGAQQSDARTLLLLSPRGAAPQPHTETFPRSSAGAAAPERSGAEQRWSGAP